MPCLLLRFVGRRFHGTPWGHHVNEGLVEWPPSPWRICRAMLATGYTKLGWEGGPPPAAMQELLTALAGTLPVYHLPPAVVAHSRHYMPIPGNTTKVLDAFAHVADGALGIEWNVALPPAATALLGELARSMSYLGRAESWVQAELVETINPTEGSVRAYPHESAAPAERGWEQVSLLAPLPATDYGVWRDAAVEREKATLRAAGKPVNPAAVKKINALFPENLAACLSVTTTWLQKQGWSQPPGSRRVLYWRPTAALEPSRSRPAPRPAKAARHPAALLALASNTQNKEVLPLLTRALPQAERLHETFASLLDRNHQLAECPELTGFGLDHQPLKGNRHAHILPLSLADDGRLDHVLIYAPMGLGGIAQEVLARVRRTYSKNIEELFVTLAGCGELEQFASRPEPGFAPLRSGHVWESLTPFVPPRHPKANRHTILDQAAAELLARGRPVAKISFMDKTAFVRAGLHRFQRRRRQGKPQPPVDGAFGLRLEFAEIQTGPIAIGYAAHFGLGLFRPRN